MLPIFNRSMSVDSSPDLEKILYRSMYVESSPDWQNFDLLPHFSKNGCQVIMLIFFEIEIFVLKYVLDNSESIPTKNNFRPKKFVIAFISTKNGQSRGFWRFLVEKIQKKILYPLLEFFYCGSFELSYSCVPLTFAEIFPSEQIGTTCSSRSIRRSWVWSTRYKNRHRRKSLVRSFGSRG